MMKRFGKALTAGLLAIVMILSLTACASTPAPKGTAAPAGPAAPVQDTVKIAWNADPGTMAPVYLTQDLGFCVYETLYTTDATKKDFEPLLATSWKYTDDTHMTLTLRKDVTDSKGNKFTAKDVLASIKYATTDLISGMYVKFIDQKASKVIDDYTVEIVLTEPNVSQWFQLSDVRMFCQAAMDASTDGMKTTPVGTGPYVVTNYTSGSSVSMKARDDYWGKKPAIKNVEWLFIAESSQRALALEAGNVDMVRETATNDFIRLQKNKDFGTFVRNTFKADAVYFNCSENSICKDPLVRKAISYAIDAEAINKVVFSGMLSTCVFTGNSACSGADTKWNSDYFKRDVAKAKDLLKQAGIAEGTGITLVFNTGLNGHSNICEIIQSQLAEVGLKVTIKSYDAATWNNVRTDPKMSDMHINLTSSPEGYYGNSLSSAVVLSNSIFYKNEKFDSLLKTSLGITDTTKQLEVNKQLNTIMMEDCPVYALVNQAWLWSYSAKLKGVKEMGEIGQRITPAILSF